MADLKDDKDGGDDKDGLPREVLAAWTWRNYSPMLAFGLSVRSSSSRTTGGCSGSPSR